MKKFATSKNLRANNIEKVNTNSKSNAKEIRIV